MSLDPKNILRSKILIVDDNATIRKMLTHICEKAGYTRISTEADGEAALDRILEWQPDLIFLDIKMPKKDGVEVCKELKALNVSQDHVIIMQTAQEDSTSKEVAFEAGVTDFIVKPFHPKEVVSRMQAHLYRLWGWRMEREGYQRIKDDLREAKKLQQVLQPSEKKLQSLYRQQQLDVALYHRPSAELSGDLIVVEHLDANRAAFIMLDVVGHGISAALYTFVMHALLHEVGLNSCYPHVVLEQLNNRFYHLSREDKFSTLFIGVIDTNENILRYAAAASPPPLVLSGEKLTSLNTKGYLLGIKKDSSYETRECPFNKGDLLCLYSDALLENHRKIDACLQENELVERLKTAQRENSERIVDLIKQDYLQKVGENFSDDLSMLVCKYV